MAAAVQAIVANTLEAEFGAFCLALEHFPAEVFSRPPAQGHSAAWHALHVMDWTRCVIQTGLVGVNPTLTYGYLGFEDAVWVQAVTGPTLAHEQDKQSVILASVQQVFGEAVEAVCHAPAERFEADAMWTTLKRPRPVLEGLMYHVRHTAYHRGQLTLVLKELT